MACKHVLPIMRAQRSGVIITISSLAAWEQYPYVTYKATKSALIAYTQQLAIQNAEYGIRANVILPGLMDTPMAVEARVKASGKSRAEVAAMRDAKVPLRKRMGTRLGRRQCGAVPGERRGELHHRRRAAGRRRHVGEGGVVSGWVSLCSTHPTHYLSLPRSGRTMIRFCCSVLLGSAIDYQPLDGSLCARALTMSKNLDASREGDMPAKQATAVLFFSPCSVPQHVISID